MTTAEFLDRLAARVHLCNGGTGTMLSAAGLPAGSPPETWNVERPTEVEAVHRAYVDAGSDIFHTNTFSGNRVALSRAGLGEQTPTLNRAATEIARRAADGRALIAADIGPTGGVLAPLGELDPEVARTAFEEQVSILAEGGVDLIVCETFMDLAEAQLAVRAAAAAGLPVVASMAFGESGRTMMGVTPEQAAVGLAEAGACVVGANCGSVTPGEMEPIIEAMAAATDRPLIAKPNAGRPRLEGGRTVHDGRPEDLAASVERFVALGARMVGGCCGTNPDFIRAAAEVIRRLG